MNYRENHSVNGVYLEMGIFSKRLRYACISLIILFLTIPRLATARYNALSVDKPDTTLANNLIKKAKKQIRNAKYDDAIKSYKMAFAIYKKAHAFGQMALSESHIAFTYGTKGELKKAFGYIKKIDPLLNNNSHINPLTACKVYGVLGRVYEFKENYGKTFEYFTLSLQTYQNNYLTDPLTLVKIYNDLANYYMDQGQYKKARDYLEQGLKLGLARLSPTATVISDIYNNLGIIFMDTGNYQKSLLFFKKDLKISKKILDKDHPNIGVTYNNIGNIYFKLGDYDNAQDYFNMSMRIFIKQFGRNHPKVAILYNNLGAIYYYKKDYDRSIDYFRRSLRIKRQTIGAENNNVATAYLNIGSIYDQKKDYNNAIAYYEKALHIKMKVFGPNNIQIASTYDDLGDIYKEEKKYREAIKYLSRELEISINSLGFNHPVTASTLINIGDVYKSEKDYNDALDYYQRAIMSLVPDFHNENLNYNPPLKDIRFEKSLLDALTDKARTLYLRYNDDGQHTADLLLSVQTYDLTTRLINNIKEGYKAEGSKLLLGEQTYKIFDRSIKAALELYNRTGQTEYKRQAFIFAERGKSSVLLESIIDSKAKKFAGIPDTLLEHEQELKENLTLYNNKLQAELNKKDKANNNKVNFWQDKLFTGKRAYQAFIKKLEKTYPKYYHLKYETPKISIPNIQKNLVTKNSAIINYFKGDTTLYIFVITKNNYQVYQNKISHDFNKGIVAFRKGIIQNNYAAYTKEAYNLYRILIQPEAHLIKDKSLVIIPDGVLGYLPFEALLTKPAPKSNNTDYALYRNLSYLIFKHTISYAYSTTLLSELSNRSTVHDNRQFLGMAPVFDNNNDKAIQDYTIRGDSLNHLLPLDASADEITDIYNLFEKNRGFFSWFSYNDSKIYLRDKATVSVLKSQLVSHYKYIHLATHAFIDEQNPEMSGIILAHSKNTNDDGILNAAEIYNLDLNARLVVLSACETAMGKVVKGEGIIGLTRSFIYAGANNLVVSLWNVSDRSTAHLMITFYTNLLNQKSIASSLCNAKRNMIRDTQYAAPLYWSPFILIGNK
ncbi:MAG TPA: CHAT domain-containing tetratricopeptide repeat protein [Balneolales bacterium]|nr:CHAT domain-containing tetratricopeptide repeat protein [Balneolales bacterium]